MKPMLANALSIEDIPRKAAGYTMEPKLDGIRAVARLSPTGVVEMWSRSKKTDLAPRLPHIVEQLRDILVPNYDNVWLDGEVGYLDTVSWTHTPGTEWPILDFNRTIRVTQSSIPEALSKQKHPMQGGQNIAFWVFDIVNLNRPTWSQSFRDGYLDGLLGSQYGSTSDIKLVPSEMHWDEDRYTQYVMEGGEGVILKNPQGVYQPDSRPAKRWYKIKKFDTFEGPIVGFDPGKGKYEGLVGALVVRHPSGTDVRCSGMDDATRIRISNYREDYLDHMCEVKFFGMVGVDASGVRHPQFLRMRPDLD